MTTTTTATDTPAPIIGVAQLRATNNKVHNLLEITKCVAWAKQKGVQMLFLPECAGFMGAVPGESLQQAEAPIGEEQPNADCVTEWIHKMYNHTLLQESNTVEEEEEEQQQPSDTVAALASEAAAADYDDDGDAATASNVSLMHGLSTLAKRAQMWISVGGLHVRGAPPHDGKERFYNTHVILDDTGTVKAIYRKIHLFDVCIPGKVNLMESNSTAAGRDIVVCDTPVGKCGRTIACVRKVSSSCRWTLIPLLGALLHIHAFMYIGRLGLSTCYDMRFPELYADLVQRGAQILLMPSAFTVPTGQAHWHILLRGTFVHTLESFFF